MNYQKIYVFHDNENLPRVKAGLYAELKSLDLTKPKQITITDYKENKTDSQRGTFHALCGILGKEVGHTMEEVKEFAKQEALGVKTVSIAGIEKEIVKSSEDAKRDEYSHLIETVYRLAAQAGVQLPIMGRNEWFIINKCLHRS
mgnify:CR=1 FL=1